MDKAFNDLVYLSERLSGILSVKDELKDYTDLKNKAKELENTANVYRTEVESLSETLETLKEAVSEAKQEAKDIIKEASDKAKDIVSKAHEDSSKIASENKLKFKEAEDAFKDQVAYYEATIKELSLEALNLSKDVQEAEQRLYKAREDLNKLKSSF